MWSLICAQSCRNADNEINNSLFPDKWSLSLGMGGDWARQNNTYMPESILDSNSWNEATRELFS
jgi:hypothetical protein